MHRRVRLSFAFEVVWGVEFSIDNIVNVYVFACVYRFVQSNEASGICDVVNCVPVRRHIHGT